MTECLIFSNRSFPKKKDVMLCLVGPKEGLYKEIKEKTVQKGLEDKVYFAGKQENIRRYLSAMDVFSVSVCFLRVCHLRLLKPRQMTCLRNVRGGV